MPTSIALLRGINVGGAHIVPMKELVLLLEAQGCVDVRTYIQSGNAVFDHPKASGDRASEIIRSAVLEKYGFEPEVLVITPKHLDRVVEANPFPDAVNDPSKTPVALAICRHMAANSGSHDTPPKRDA